MKINETEESLHITRSKTKNKAIKVVFQDSWHNFCKIKF